MVCVQAESKREAKMQKLLGSRDALKHRIHNHIHKQTLALQEADSKVSHSHPLIPSDAQHRHIISAQYTAQTSPDMLYAPSSKSVPSDAAKTTVCQEGAPPEVQSTCRRAQSKPEAGLNQEGMPYVKGGEGEGGGSCWASGTQRVVNCLKM